MLLMQVADLDFGPPCWLAPLANMAASLVTAHRRSQGNWYTGRCNINKGHWSSYRSSLAVLISSLAQMSANTSLIQSRYLRHWVNTLFLADDLPSRISTLALCAFTMSMGHYRLAFSRHASVGSAYA